MDGYIDLSRAINKALQAAWMHLKFMTLSTILHGHYFCGWPIQPQNAV